jgi:hypothetical protein
MRFADGSRLRRVDPQLRGVVGTIEAGTQASDVDNELAWANWLLGMDANALDTHDADGNGVTESYATSSTDYSAILSGGTQVQNSTDVSGYEWVLAKYDGMNAGYVLFYVPDLEVANTVPQTSYSLWGSNSGQYDISHFTGFGSTSVPDGGATLMLLGGALVGLESLRRRFRV